MIDKWKSISQDNKVKFIIIFLSVLGYLGKRWLEPIKPTDTQATQVQTTSGDNSPLVNETTGNVTINYNNPASDKLLSDNRDTDLRIINARLIPYPGFTFFREGTITFGDKVSTYVEVRNFGDKPIHLTSIDVDIVGNGPLKFGGDAPFRFGSDPRRNESIILKPGKSKELPLRKGIFMEGLSEILCEHFLDAWIRNYREKYEPYQDNLYITNSSNDIALLNSILAKQFGSDAGIKLTFYSNYRKVLTQHILLLSNGTDLFNSKSGRFQHDVFLGTGLVQLFDELKKAASIQRTSPDGKKEQYLDMEKYVKKYEKCYEKTPNLY